MVPCYAKQGRQAFSASRLITGPRQSCPCNRCLYKLQLHDSKPYLFESTASTQQHWQNKERCHWERCHWGYFTVGWRGGGNCTHGADELLRPLVMTTGGSPQDGSRVKSCVVKEESLYLNRYWQSPVHVMSVQFVSHDIVIASQYRFPGEAGLGSMTSHLSSCSSIPLR